MPDPPLPKGYSMQEEPPLPKGYSFAPPETGTIGSMRQAPDSVLGGAGRRIAENVKGVGDLVKSKNPVKDIGQGIVSSEKEAAGQAKSYFHQAKDVNDPVVKALLYLRSGTTAASMLLPMLATPSVTNINKLEDEGRSKEAVGAGLTDAALLGLGTKKGATTASKGLGDAGTLSKADAATSRYLGLQKSDLPKWERTKVGSVEEVGKTVREKVGIKSDITQQHQAIEDVREQYQQKTNDLLAKSMNVNSTAVQPMIKNIATKLSDELEKSGVTPEQLKAVSLNADALLKEYAKPNMTPPELLEMRQAIQKQIKWSSDPGQINVKNQFYTTLYHDLNDAIEKSLLDPEAQKNFRDYNRTQNRLIIAREAAGKKIVNTALKAHPGMATALARIAGGAAAGGVGGAAFGHAGIGAGMGAAAPALEALRHVNFPAADIRLSQARGMAGQAAAPVVQGAAGAGVAGENQVPMPR